MVAEQSCVKRLWSIVPELYQDGYRGTIGTAGAVPAAVWSRQLYYMLSLSTSGEAQRRLQNVPEGEGAEAWKVFSEHDEPKTATRYVGMLRQILLYDFGEFSQLIDRIEQFRHLVRKYEEQSGESVTECAAGCVPSWHQGRCDQRPPGSPCG